MVSFASYDNESEIKPLAVTHILRFYQLSYFVNLGSFTSYLTPLTLQVEKKIQKTFLDVCS